MSFVAGARSFNPFSVASGRKGADVEPPAAYFRPASDLISVKSGARGTC